MLTRLSIDTLRAWEKRYAVVRPLRKNGIRLYREADIERLSLLRQTLERGYSIGRAAKLSNAELLALKTPAPMPSRASAAGDAAIEFILAAVDVFDYAAADRELSRAASLMSPRDLIYRIALPLMRIAGERWHEQRLRIAQEHMLSQLLGNLLGGMIRIHARPSPRATILTATLSGDLHCFGLLASAILAAGAGLGVVHLGASLPAKEVIFAARRSEADVVLISVTAPEDILLSREQLKSIRSQIPNTTEVWMGLNPPELDLRLKGIVVLEDFHTLETQLQRVGGKL
jgi:DNA-binding transcriptional MerR regulator/methylmalonyl-CoA mutase cobalamin-binding subunit